jgi:hypothetical protein
MRIMKQWVDIEGNHSSLSESAKAFACSPAVSEVNLIKHLFKAANLFTEIRIPDLMRSPNRSTAALSN